VTAPTEPRRLDAFIDALIDGELDLKSRLDMEQQIENDPQLRKQVDEMRQLRQAVREHATYHAAPDALRRRIAASAALPAQMPAVMRGKALQRWAGWRPLAASLSFAAVLAVAVNLAWLQSSKDERLMEDVVASHVRSTLGQHLVDVASSDRHTVKPFLSSKLGFSPPVDELQIPGSVFLGGRVDYLDGRPVAALVYRQGQHIVNSFVWPSTARSDSAPSFSASRGFQTAQWSHDGMNHWVISDVNRQEFGLVVGAIQSASAGR
jgi:anti-sigma factor RsiW